MEEPNRRSFLLAAFAFALGGCAGGFYRGGEERVVPVPRSKPMPEIDSPDPPISLYSKDPVYPGTLDENWSPNLTPVPRRVWAQASPINHRLTPMGRITRITIHHEGAESPNRHTRLEEVAADLRDIRKVHLRVLGAGDIGYHYIIDRAGRIWAGRPAAYRGAHAGGKANLGNLGIMLLGNFDIQKPSARQLRALRHFLLLQMGRYGVGVRRIHTHQELKPTRCPGRHLQSFMNKLRTSL